MVKYHIAVSAMLLLASHEALAKKDRADSGEKIVNGMIHFGANIRKSLKPTKVPLQQPLRYQGGDTCSFEVVWSRTGATELSGAMVIKTSTVRDRVAISIDSVGGQSSLLISPEGQIRNLNSVDPFTQRRTTMNNFEVESERMKNEVRKALPGRTDADVLLGLPLFPRIIDSQLTVGSKVAVLDSTRGEWAAYHYQGMITYKDRSGALLDLIKKSASDGRSYRIGFLVVEPTTMMPIFFIFENFDRIRTRVDFCSK